MYYHRYQCFKTSCKLYIFIILPADRSGLDDPIRIPGDCARGPEPTVEKHCHSIFVFLPWQYDRRCSAGAEEDHGDLLEDDSFCSCMQRLWQNHRANTVSLRCAALLQTDGRTDPGTAAGCGGKGAFVRVRWWPGGRHFHCTGRHETGKGGGVENAELT